MDGWGARLEEYYSKPITDKTGVKISRSDKEHNI
jgi:hypothetical protein